MAVTWPGVRDHNVAVILAFVNEKWWWCSICIHWDRRVVLVEDWQCVEMEDGGCRIMVFVITTGCYY